MPRQVAWRASMPLSKLLLASQDDLLLMVRIHLQVPHSYEAPLKEADVQFASNNMHICRMSI